MSSNTTSWKRYLSLRFLAGKLRERGIVWCLKRALRMIYRPVRRYARSRLRRISWMIPSLSFLLWSGAQPEKRILAICDFRTTPWTVGELLYFQEITMLLRLEHKVDKIDVIWLCDSKNPARPDQGMTQDNYHYHLSALLPLAHVNPHLGSFLLMDSPGAVESYVVDNLHRYHVFPPSRDYLVKQSTYTDYFNRVQRFYTEHGFIPHLSCKPAMISWAYSFIEKEVHPNLPIVVHLRNRSDARQRNAILESWLEFFAFCKGKFNVKFIIIGTRGEIDPRFRCLENVIYSKDYGTTVEQDVALIQTSLMYLGTCSGINIAAKLSNVPYILFRYRPVHAHITYGSQIPWAISLQRLFWEPETTGLLIHEFTDIYRQIDILQWEQNFDKVVRGNSTIFKK